MSSHTRPTLSGHSKLLIGNEDGSYPLSYGPWVPHTVINLIFAFEIKWDDTLNVQPDHSSIIYSAISLSLSLTLSPISITLWWINRNLAYRLILQLPLRKLKSLTIASLWFAGIIFFSESSICLILHVDSSGGINGSSTDYTFIFMSVESWMKRLSNFFFRKRKW